MTNQTISLHDLKMPSGSARYIVDSQIPMSVLMLAMLTSVPSGGVMAIFKDARDSVLTHKSLAASEIFTNDVDTGRIMIGPYSSISIQLLHRLGGEYGLSQFVEVLTPDDQKLFLEHMLDVPGSLSGHLVDSINKWKANRINPSMIQSAGGGDKASLKLAEIFAKYEKGLIEEEFEDFSSVSVKLVDGVAAKPALCAEIAKAYPVIFADMSGIEEGDSASLLRGLVAAGVQLVTFVTNGDREKLALSSSILPIAKQIVLRSAA